MGILAEKLVTISIGFRVTITDDELRTPNAHNQKDANESLRLLNALLRYDKDLPTVLLKEIAYVFSQLSEDDFEEAILGKCGSEDPDFFFNGGMLQGTVATLDPSDQKLWHDRMEMEDKGLGNLFALHTENFDRCFHPVLEKAHFVEIKDLAIEAEISSE
jgi:hypothetical protein